MFRAAVIGVGSHGQESCAHLWPLCPNVELAGDCRPGSRTGLTPSPAQRRCPGSRRYPCVINPPVDGVVVAVPTADHARGCRAAAGGRDVAVLIEKPIATSLARGGSVCSALADVVRGDTGGGAYGAAQPGRRRGPAADLRHHGSSRCTGLPRFKPRSLDVDVILDVMIHDIDIRARDRRRRSRPRSRPWACPVLSGRIDIANVRLRFPDGCIANLTASRISRERVRKLRVFQPHALVSVDYAEPAGGGSDGHSPGLSEASRQDRCPTCRGSGGRRAAWNGNWPTSFARCADWRGAGRHRRRWTPGARRGASELRTSLQTDADGRVRRNGDPA